MALRNARLDPSLSLPHPKLPPRSQHADNRTQCEVHRERGYEHREGLSNSSSVRDIY